MNGVTSFQEIILSSGVFRRETASGFYPWGKVDSPRKRVAEGLCGWRHGNSFPMTQSAQSHRQMRSIQLCSKAVFYVFVFGSIHDSTTMQNLSPGFFPQNGGLRSVLSIPAIHTIISRCFLGLCEVCTFVAEKRRYIMKLVVEFLMSICHGVVVFVSCIGKLPRKLWRFNKKHHCISFDNNSIDSLYDWDDDDDF